MKKSEKCFQNHPHSHVRFKSMFMSKSNHHLQDLLFTTVVGNVCPEKAFHISYLQNVATLNEAGISTPTGSVLCTVHYTRSLCWPDTELRAGLRLWSQTGVSCKPWCRLETWYHGSAVPGSSSSCRIFSYSSFSSSFCG